MSLFINGIGNISAQNTFGSRTFNELIIKPETEDYLVIAPDYKEFIDPKLVRRMSKVIKLGVCAASKALQDADIEKPDAIVTATALGCTQDTDRFLSSMIEFEEQTLSPTSFIQSTHNTIGGQIALQLGLHEYNMCYTQRGLSFESALLDAMMLIESDEAKSVLAGGFDELIPQVKALQERMGKYRNSRAGEGAAFFVLENRQHNSYAKLLDVATFTNIVSNDELSRSLDVFLDRHGFATKDIDTFISGEVEGAEIRLNSLSHATKAIFKPFCGEYQTAVGFALWLAAISLHQGNVPDAFVVGNSIGEMPKKVLIYNQYQQRNHSFILLTKC